MSSDNFGEVKLKNNTRSLSHLVSTLVIRMGKLLRHQTPNKLFFYCHTSAKATILAEMSPNRPVRVVASDDDDDGVPMEYSQTQSIVAGSTLSCHIFTTQSDSLA